MKPCSLYYQRGAILLLIVSALILALGWLSYSVLGNAKAKLARQQMQDVAQQLNDAKENLLTFARMQPELYPNVNLDQVSGAGYFPPPDFDNDGRMGRLGGSGTFTNTAASGVIGVMPAKTGDVSPNLYFYARTCGVAGSVCSDAPSLWYAMTGWSNTAGDIRINSRTTGVGTTRPLNSITLRNELRLNADGSPQANACASAGVICLDGLPVVAVVIASGDVLSGQSNRQLQPLQINQFLDMDNADSNSSAQVASYQFISHFPVGQQCATNPSKPDACFNDRVLAITYADWVSAVESRVKSNLGWFSDRNSDGVDDGQEDGWNDDKDHDGIKNCLDSDWYNNVSGLTRYHWIIRNQWYLVPSLCSAP
ncbi:MAG: hypothetical protein K0U21_03365 [Proteobacteria bacterium]|nr:hypothetical protein [Pseudomonadota bacterium]